MEKKTIPLKLIEVALKALTVFEGLLPAALAAWSIFLKNKLSSGKTNAIITETHLKNELSNAKIDLETTIVKNNGGRRALLERALNRSSERANAGSKSAE